MKPDMENTQQRGEKVIRKIETLGGTAVWEQGFCAVTLSDSSVSDSDLVLFEDLPQVEILNLSNTGITDAGLSHLAKLVRLETLTIDGTDISEEAVDWLKASLPDTQIITTPPPKDQINPFTGEPFE